MTAQWKSNDPVIPTGACTGTYGSQRNVNLAVNGVENFDYTGNVVCAYLQKAGYYKLEVWGAQGDQNNGTRTPGYGGYSVGKISVSGASSIYIAVGQMGRRGNVSTANSYNGGGATKQGNSAQSAGGGGATHISLQNCGELKNCSSYKGTYDSSKGTYDGGKILIVAGGGGGASYESGNGSNGGSGGGKNGSPASDNSAKGGTQNGGGSGSTNSSTTGGAGSFGLGGDNAATCNGGGAGGGGWYGGGSGSFCAGSSNSAGGGGSGYIGNSLLLQDKGMYQYSTGCTSSTDATTKTTCISSIGAHVANYANTGNGYARITYLGT